MDRTKIEWCDSTWNPVTGCLHDCEYCYAKKMAHRFGGAFGTEENFIGSTWSTEADGSNHVLDLPIKDECKEKTAPYPFEFDPTFHRYRLDEPQHWKKPRTIFVCSMADLFGEWVPDEWIEAVFEACAKAPQHRYLFLTKNPQRYVELDGRNKLPIRDNMWYGASVTTPEQAEETAKRFGKLPCTPKQANTFLSVEPMLFDIAKHNAWKLFCSGYYADWIIVGAETGNRKDKVIPQREWLNSIAADCNDYGKPVFMKDSLIPIIGEENMLRGFPWETPEQRKEG